LRAQALACQKGGRLLFKGLEMVVQPAQVWWVRGSNGRGKTSLLRILAGLTQAASGRVSRHAPVLYLGHQHALKDDLTARESLDFLLGLNDQRIDEAAQLSALAHWGVQTRSQLPIRALSQGQRRRVALARLEFGVPGAVWILDEPFDALDAQGCQLLRLALGTHVARGGAVVLTSHQPLSMSQARELDLEALVTGSAACGH
jgi:heme exporter protein A